MKHSTEPNMQILIYIYIYISYFLPLYFQGKQTTTTSFNSIIHVHLLFLRRRP